MKHSLSIFLVFVFSSGAQALQVLTWEECVRIAMANNAQIQAAQAQLRSLDFLEDASKANFLPQLSAVGTYGRTVTETRATGATAGSTTNTTGYSGSLVANMNIFSGFQDVGNMWKAQANERAGRANLQTVKAQVSYDLKSAFEGLLYAKEYQKLTLQIIDRRKENMGLVELRFEGGRENKGSVLLSRAYLAQAKYDDLQARNAQRVARRQLSRALGYDDFAEYDITGVIPVKEPSDLPKFEDLAMETPDMALVKAQLEAAEAQVTVSRAPFMPSVDLSGAISETDQHFFPDQAQTSTLGVKITFPFFSGGKDYNSTRSSIELRGTAQSNRRNISRQVLARLEQLYAAYIEAVMKFQVDLTFRDATTARAEIARKKYNNGLQTFEDWDVIESDLINRQKVYLTSKRDRTIAEAAWEQVQGKGAFQ